MPQTRHCVHFRESSLGYACTCVQSPCPNYPAGYELHTDAFSEQSKTFRRFRVNFAGEQLVASHRQVDERSANLPSKKNTRILARTLLESFHDFVMLLIRYQVLRFCRVSRYASRVAFSFRLPFYSSMRGNLSFYRDLHF